MGVHAGGRTSPLTGMQYTDARVVQNQFARNLIREMNEGLVREHSATLNPQGSEATLVREIERNDQELLGSDEEHMTDEQQQLGEDRRRGRRNQRTRSRYNRRRVNMTSPERGLQ